MPLVSMLIPSFNHARYIRWCIESVIQQDYENIELIIIDDGSSDESVGIINAMVHKCVARFSRFEFRARENRGLSATMNEGLEWSTGVYFASLASDDILLAHKTSLLVKKIEVEDSVCGVFGGVDIVDDQNCVIDQLVPVSGYYSFDDVITLSALVLAPAQLLKLKALKGIGGYKADIEDWSMWLQLTKAGYRLKVIPDILVKYRRHRSNVSKASWKMFESRKQILSNYSDCPRYRAGMAKVHALAALDFSSTSKILSIKLLLQSIRLNAGIVFSYEFLQSSIRVFVPRLLIGKLRQAKLFFAKKRLMLDSLTLTGNNAVDSCGTN